MRIPKPGVFVSRMVQSLTCAGVGSVTRRFPSHCTGDTGQCLKSRPRTSDAVNKTLIDSRFVLTLSIWAALVMRDGLENGERESSIGPGAMAPAWLPLVALCYPFSPHDGIRAGATKRHMMPFAAGGRAPAEPPKILATRS